MLAIMKTEAPSIGGGGLHLENGRNRNSWFVDLNYQSSTQSFEGVGLNLGSEGIGHKFAALRLQTQNSSFREPALN
jgi:hypothetical protein